MTCMRSRLISMSCAMRWNSALSTVIEPG